MRRSRASYRCESSVKLIDLNLLLYAVNRDSPRHEAAKRWVDEIFSGTEGVALPWTVILGFLRLSTSRRAFPSPLSTEDALSIVDSWLDRPQVRVLHPGEEHWRIFRELVGDAGTAGNLVTDAHLAALAIEHGADLCSTDADFGRFDKLRWSNPLTKVEAP